MEAKEKRNLICNLVSFMLLVAAVMINFCVWNSSSKEETPSLKKITGTIITDKGVYTLSDEEPVNKIHGTIITSRGIISDGEFTPME